MKSIESRPIQLNLISDDKKLAMALGSVMGPDFVLVPEPWHEQGRQFPPGEHSDVIVFDMDTFDAGSEGRSEAQFQRIMAAGIPVILMAGDETRDKATALVERGAYGYVRKPPALRELKALVRSACETRRLRHELESAQRQLERVTGLHDLIGSSAPMQLVYKLVRKVSNLEASVLITGESGTGKELIARAIHETGNRSRRPFVAVSCSAIPDTLFESELFGHEKGAFTGSSGTHEGYFEQAGDGTIFLDEIGELNAQAQVKLLRVLQQREFRRLGSSRTTPLRARIILATHRNLSQMVASGEFRQDLFYRINVMCIQSPALRQRSADIPLLVLHFVTKYGQLYGKPVEGIEPEALELLQRFSWPGNVRELENIIQRAIIMADGYSIGIDHLPEAIQFMESESELLPGGCFERLLREYKIKVTMDAIQQCNGNKTLAAQSLSISRAYLHRLIRQGPGMETGVTEITRGQLRSGQHPKVAVG